MQVRGTTGALLRVATLISSKREAQPNPILDDRSRVARLAQHTHKLGLIPCSIKAGILRRG